MKTATAPNGKPKVAVKLVGEDGNAFAILGRCTKEMRRAGWTKDETDEFVRKATSGDYDHLLATAMDYCDDIGKEDDE